MTDTDMRTLLTRLDDAGLLVRMPEDSDTAHTEETAGYAHILHALSGWLAALFLLLAFGTMFHRFFMNTAMLLGTGISLVAIAWLLLSRRDLTPFVAHVALALSMAGQVMIILALGKSLGYPSQATLLWWIVALMEGLLAWGIPHTLHRFISALGLTVAVHQGFWMLGLGHASMLLLLGLVAGLWMHECHPRLPVLPTQAIAWGATAGLLLVTGTVIEPWMGWYHTSHAIATGWLHQVPIALLDGILLFWIARTLLRPNTPPLSGGRTLLLSAMAALVALLSTRLHGLDVMVALMGIGFGRGNRPLLILGTLGLIGVVGHFYYTLETTLLIKSAMLTGTGILLLALYALLRHLQRNKELR